MVEFLRNLLAADFMPHVQCLRDPAVIWLQVTSDGLIAASYFIIPLALLRFVKQRGDLAFRWVFLLFGLFILACGITHAFSVLTLWHPVYRLEGVIKAITSVISFSTAILLVRVLPNALLMPGPAQIRQLNATLQQRVRERTQELEKSRLDLQAKQALFIELSTMLDVAHVLIRDLDGRIVFWSGGA